jgi:ABC-type Fe3+/spermidine/putrescine transport system ATPase subunit
VFSNGRLEQIGSPLEVYNRPANRFVGQFIGDSNFFAGRIDAASPAIAELAGIGPVKIAATADMPTGPVDVLIRPERLHLVEQNLVEQHLVEQAGGPDNVFETSIDDVINYGDSLLAIGKTRGLPIRARIAGRQANALTAGQTIKLGWSATDAHVLAQS